MNERTKAALEGSIKKWEQIILGEAVDKGTDNCPLCQLFFAKYCVGCPVRKRTGVSSCRLTPYAAMHEAYDQELRDLVGGRIWWTDPKACVIGPKTMEVAIKEHEFLCSLRED